MDAKRATLRDVAAAAGVSRALAGFVLGDDHGKSIPEATRERVREAARNLGYVPHGIARALREGSSRVVVLSIDPSSGGSCTLVGSTVTFAAEGTCVIDANQAGNASYTPAAQVQQSITVVPAPTTTAPAITSPPGATVSARQPFSITITATGNPTPTIGKSGSLPYGVSFTAGSGGTATIAGTARRSRTYRITITASNGVSPSASQVFTLTVS